jgi:hypothetical protein
VSEMMGKCVRAAALAGLLASGAACAGGEGVRPGDREPVNLDSTTGPLAPARDSAAPSDQSDTKPTATPEETEPPVDPLARLEASPADGKGTAGSPASDGAEPGPPLPPPPPLSTLPVPMLPGALLPQTRIVAFYGNPASARMGILGELPPDEMLTRLDAEVRAWREADPLTPVRPALQIIAVMATGDPGRDSLFRLRAPDERIQQVADWARRREALLFLDVQPGHSTVAAELPHLESWLARPDVHLALDPEWALPPGVIPGRAIGSMNADDINLAIGFLADMVDRYHLPPKILVVHRFTRSMINGADEIRRDPRVQVVINMDGWGPPANKRAAYRDVVVPEADQFTGFKLFFHNDLRDGSVLLTPAEILTLEPPPLYIQYQ